MPERPEKVIDRDVRLFSLFFATKASALMVVSAQIIIGPKETTSEAMLSENAT